jgi:hypothetical protein
MICTCSRFIDIRGRCLPNRNIKEWKKCKAKVDTTYWLMFNDYDIYKLIEEYSIRDKKVIDAVKKTYNITNKQWEEILEIYENDEEQNKDIDE